MKKKGKWKRYFIYRYLNVVGKELDMGLYPSWVMARHYQLRKMSWGAITCDPIEVDAGYELYKGEY